MTQKKKVGLTISYIVLILISIIWLFPFFCLIMQSFRSYQTEFGGMVNYLFPKKFSLDSYKYLFGEGAQFTKWYLNTLIIAAVSTLLQTIIIICVSYALSRMRFNGRKLLMNIWLVLGMFPGFLTMICLYFLLKQLGLTQSGAIPGLILIYVASSGMGY